MGIELLQAITESLVALTDTFLEHMDDILGEVGEVWLIEAAERLTLEGEDPSDQNGDSNGGSSSSSNSGGESSGSSSSSSSSGGGGSSSGSSSSSR